LKAGFLEQTVVRNSLLNGRKKWKEILMTLRVTMNINDLKKQGVDLQNISLPGYLSIHCAAQKVLQKSNLSFMLSLKSAYDGPFKLHGDANWECQKMQSLLAKDEQSIYKQSLLKLRGSDRNCLTSQYLR
jgi:hypothetical protein